MSERNPLVGINWPAFWCLVFFLAGMLAGWGLAR